MEVEVLAQISEDPEIGVLVLGAGAEKSGPGPLVSQMIKSSAHLPIPLTVVPGNLSKEQLEAVC
ncbi:MAG: universal stress protein, partial [Mangrovicoccus sp.]